MIDFLPVLLIQELIGKADAHGDQQAREEQHRDLRYRGGDPAVGHHGRHAPSAGQGAARVGKKQILLNFDKVDFIDSFGVGEILASYISTHNLGGKLKLARISKKLFLIFQVTMLTKVLDIHDEEDSALQSFFKD